MVPHAPPGFARHTRHAVEINIEGRPPFLLAHIEKTRLTRHACIVDENGDGGEFNFRAI